jgi:hypothetical protein
MREDFASCQRLVGAANVGDSSGWVHIEACDCVITTEGLTS